MFADDLRLYGPGAAARAAIAPWEARRYCRHLARRHYENFTVAQWLLPRQLRQHVANIYAYCRWADDLADEVRGHSESLALLAWWEEQLRQCYAGRTCHPVYVALTETIARFDIPPEPFLDLLDAFRQDQQLSRYETREQVLDYCRRSANPVGRLVLCLGRCHDQRRAELADAVCTGLQLANFCQDVAEDWDRGRVYLPRDACRRFGYDEPMFAARQCNEAFRRLMAHEVDHAEGWLRRGAALVELMPRSLRLSVALFVHGGLAILEAIRRRDYDVWSARPTLSRVAKFRLAAGCWWRLKRPG